MGTDILLGQPSKVDNQIITIPHAAKIKFRGVDGTDHTVFFPLRDCEDIQLHDVLKVDSSMTLFPRDMYTYQLPNQFLNQQKICVIERPGRNSWIGSQILDVEDGCINLVIHSSLCI